MAAGACVPVNKAMGYLPQAEFQVSLASVVFGFLKRHLAPWLLAVQSSLCAAKTFPMACELLRRIKKGRRQFRRSLCIVSFEHNCNARHSQSGEVGLL